MSRNGRNPKSPAFQLYPTDFLADPKVQAMTCEEFGAYCQLLFQAWIDGGVPNDPAQLARRTRLSRAKFAKAWETVGPCFVEASNGLLVNPRMERERSFQAANRERLKKMAKKAADERWKADSDMPDACVPHAEGMPNHAHPIPDAQSPTPDTQYPTPGVEEPADEPPASTPPRSRKPATGPNAECIRHWESEWTRTRLGTTYAVQTKDGVAVAWMLKQSDAQEVRRRMTAMLEREDAWTTANASLSLLRSHWNSYAVDVTAPSTQGTGGMDWLKKAGPIGAHK